MKLEELLGDKNRSEEKDAVREFSTYLKDDLGYPASSIRAEVFVAPGAVADLAVLDPATSAIRALVEFKREVGQNDQSLERGIRTIERYLKSLPPINQVRAFVVLYGRERQRIYEVRATATKLDADEIASFPRWKRLRVEEGSSSQTFAKFVRFTGALAEERRLLDRILTESRKHLVSLLDASTDELSESVLSEVISQIDLRFSDIASVDDVKQEAEFLQSVLTFCDFLDSSRVRLDAFGGTEESVGVELESAFTNLAQELRGVLARQEIQRLLASYRQSAEGSIPPSQPKARLDILIVTAMDDPEYREVLKILRDPKNVTPFMNANHAVCFEGELVGGSASVVAATQNDMGMANAAVLTTKLVNHYRPYLVVMLGISAGVDPKNQAVGDVIVPTHTFDLALGKLEREGKWSVFKPKTYQKDVRDHFPYFAQLLVAKDDLVLREAIQESWNVNNPANKLKSPPRIQLGAFGSGGTVIADPEEVKIYKSTNTAIIGFDMEAHAVVVGAVESGVSERVQVLVAKSICDFAGKDKKVKKDVKQQLAAFTSAQFFRLFYLKYVSNSLKRN
ncbi:hypothetical protein ACFPPF_09910 [Xenophilus aerolatus]|nr:hypothetical protein [Xenophilus aerolatus]